MKIQREAQPLVSALFSEVEPIREESVKIPHGKRSWNTSFSLTEMTDANATVLADAMKAYGILD